MNESYRKLLNQALELHSKGELDNAKKAYRKVLEINPSEAIALAWLGSIEGVNKNYSEAKTLLELAIKLDPNNADYWANLSTVLYESKLLGNSLEIINKAIMLDGSNAKYFKNRAIINVEMENFKEALDDIEKVKNFEIEFDSETFLILGNIQRGLNKLEEAEKNYRKSIAFDEYNYEAFLNLANLLSESGNKESAIQNYLTAISINNNYSEAYVGLASTYLDLDNLDNALLYCKNAINLNKNDIDAINLYGAIEIKNANFKNALDCFEKILFIEPDNPSAKYNKSLVLLRLNNSKLGFELYEWRWRIKEFKKNANVFKKPLWLGLESLKDKIIIIHAEQGLGDTIQFSRYIEDVSRLGAYIIFQVPPSLLSLFNGAKGINKITSSKDINENYDFHCPLMSLPLALGGIGIHKPYLAANDKLINKWHKYIGDRGFRVAICWQGSHNSEIDSGRSFSVELFNSISKINNIRLISLQKNRLENDSSDLNNLHIEQLPSDFDKVNGAFMDSAAIMKNVDLVITSDTALTHLAGALGVRTFLLLQHVPDWRWGINASDCIWYPNHMLFRQKTRGDWISVFEDVKKALEILINK
jgi:tetratricopeptide (TPR) repeat protein